MRLVTKYATLSCEYLIAWTLVSASLVSIVVLLVLQTETLVPIEVVVRRAVDASFCWRVERTLAALVLAGASTQ